MNKRYKNSIRNKVLDFINNLDEDVIFRADVADLASERQISRALIALQEDGELIRLGYGIYVRANKHPEFNYEPLEVILLSEAWVIALNRLSISWELGKLWRDYNEGLSQQIPAKIIIRLKQRFRRKLVVEGAALIMEDNKNVR